MVDHGVSAARACKPQPPWECCSIAPVFLKVFGLVEGIEEITHSFPAGHLGVVRCDAAEVVLAAQHAAGLRNTGVSDNPRRKHMEHFTHAASHGSASVEERAVGGHHMWRHCAGSIAAGVEAYDCAVGAVHEEAHAAVACSVDVLHAGDLLRCDRDGGYGFQFVREGSFEE